MGAAGKRGEQAMADYFGRQGLVRPREGRVIAGVCAGLGRRFGLSPWTARILFILVLLVIPGSQLIVYPIREVAPGPWTPERLRATSSRWEFTCHVPVRRTRRSSGLRRSGCCAPPARRPSRSPTTWACLASRWPTG